MYGGVHVLFIEPLAGTGVASMNKPQLLEEAKEGLYSSVNSSGEAGGGRHPPLYPLQSRPPGSMPLPSSSAAPYCDADGKFPAYEERARRMTPNPFFQLDQTLLVKDILTSGASQAHFTLKHDWQKCSPLGCDRCGPHRCQKVVRSSSPTLPCSGARRRLRRAARRGGGAWATGWAQVAAGTPAVTTRMRSALACG